MNAKCRTARVCSSSSPSEAIGDPISNNGFEFSINFLHLFRQLALLKSHFAKSSVTSPPSRPSATATGFPVAPFRSDTFEFPQTIVHTCPPSPFQRRLSFHCCCCYCCPQLEALLDVPCASSSLPVVPRSHRSFRSPVPNSVLQVAVVQVAVALAEAVAPNRLLLLPPSPGGARGCLPSPSGRCLLRWGSSSSRSLAA